MIKLSLISKTAIWAITPGGLQIGQELLQVLSFKVSLFVSNTIVNSFTTPESAILFDKLSAIFKEQFKNYDAHICIFSTGIAVRMAAPLLQSKLTDPAIVVVDDRGFHAISLVSGHLGGANELTLEIARIIGGSPVITTATDINNLPSIDMVAKKLNLFIENPEMIKKVNMAFLQGEKIRLIDPLNLVTPHIPEQFLLNAQHQNDLEQNRDIVTVLCDDIENSESRAGEVSRETIIQDKRKTIRTPLIHKINANKNMSKILILRPLSLVAGMGCNRGTTKTELMDFLVTGFKEHNLSINSLAAVATTTIKQDETGLLELVHELGKPIKFYDKTELNSVKTIQNPSEMVEKHIGVKSVCEAAAILAAHNGHLIVPKIKKGNATLAVARIMTEKKIDFL